MIDSKRIYNIAIAFDKNYLNPFYALIASILINNSEAEIRFHCITRDVSELIKKQIVDYLTSFNSTINFYEINEEIISNFVIMNHWNTSVYFKLFFPLFVKSEIKTLLYLDTDTLVVNSLEELFNTQLNDKIAAVIKDEHVGNEAYFELHNRENYFNSGVMLIDIKKWNELTISQKVIKYLNDYPEKIIYVDQDALNVILENKYLLIPEKYNYTFSHFKDIPSRTEITNLLNFVVIIHFTISRPWNLLCENRLNQQYKLYLSKYPYSNKAIIDFSISKIPFYLKIRFREYYSDNPILIKIWRYLKNAIV
jgi:lipopolysaccharide biosynthesis glycosyltransferase